MKRVIVAAVLTAVVVASAAQAHIAPAPGNTQHRLLVRIAHDRGVIAAVDKQARAAGSAMFVEWHMWLDRQWHARDLAAALRAHERASNPYYSVDGCTRALIGRESGWSVHATNPHSGAYGLPQALPGSKMASAGPDWRENPWTQLKWFYGYVQKYGGPCGADAFQRAHGYY